MTRLSKGDQTRRQIIAEAATLLNRSGYHGTSMAELMLATGLEKGGIYRHFASKDEIARAAFAHYLEQLAARIQSALRGAETHLDRLLALIRTLGAVAWDPVVKGGCMVMNMAVESDYADHPLREEARRALQRWHRLVLREIRSALDAGELDPSTDPEALASLIVCSIDGATMHAGMERDKRKHIDHVIAHLEKHIENLRT